MIGDPADPWGFLEPDSDPHGILRPHQTDKTNPPLITDQRAIRLTQNTAGAPRSTTEADTNSLRDV